MVIVYRFELNLGSSSPSSGGGPPGKLSLYTFARHALISRSSSASVAAASLAVRLGIGVCRVGTPQNERAPSWGGFC